MTLAWTPDQSTLLLISFVLNAMLALALILMFVHFHGGMKTLFSMHATTPANAMPVVNITHVVDQAYVDAAIARAMAARAIAQPQGPVIDLTGQPGVFAAPPWERK